MDILKVLIVDDDLIDLIRYRTMLIEYPRPSFQCIEADNAFDALKICVEQKIDCVLLDYDLPDMNGLEFVKELRKSNKFLPVVMFTGQGNETVAVAAMKEGATDYIIKGTHNNHSLVKVIIAAVEKSSLEMTIHRQEKQLKHLAYYDSLTGLMNRYAFDETGRRAISNAKRHQNILTLLYIDLDHFKTINDTLGHPAGDELLQIAAKRIQAVLRSEDIIARFGGDEFVILLVGLTTDTDAHLVAKKIIAELTKPFQLSKHIAYIGASIGIAYFPAAGDNLTDLLKHADIALYKAKTDGRGTFYVFSDDLIKRHQQQLFVEQGLQVAIEKKEFFIVYEPKFELKTKKIIGMEASLRWQHPQLGVITPDYLFPRAEKSGLMTLIAKWTIETACQQFQCWREHTLKNLSLSIAVNFSAQLLTSTEFKSTLNNALQHIDPAAMVEFETTELALTSQVDDNSILENLSPISLILSIDSTDKNHFSFDRFKQFPITSLKIDCPSIQGNEKNDKDVTIVKLIIDKANELNITVIAAEIEIESQCNFLIDNGCQYGQGPLFSKPLEAHEMDVLLTKQN